MKDDSQIEPNFFVIIFIKYRKKIRGEWVREKEWAGWEWKLYTVLGCHGGLENAPPWLAVKNVLDEKREGMGFFKG